MRLATLELQAPLNKSDFIFHKHAPFEQSGEVVLVDAFLSDHAVVGGQQWQSDGQQVWFTAQTVAEHPASYQAHEVDLRDQLEVCKDGNPTVATSNQTQDLERASKRTAGCNMCVFTLCVSISRSFWYRFIIRLRYDSNSAFLFCLASTKLWLLELSHGNKMMIYTLAK